MTSAPDTSTAGSAARPWDARLARKLVRPLVGTAVTPNHITALRLIVGICGVVFIALDGYRNTNIGMLLVALSNFIDHGDGELARLSGKTSVFGHYFDLGSDALITIGLFVCIGVSLSDNGLGSWSLPLGLLSGLSVSAIFYMRMQIEAKEGKLGIRQPSFGGFEIEDVLYLLPLVTAFDVLQPFLVAAAIGAPAFALWTLRDYLRLYPIFGNAFRASRRQ